MAINPYLREELADIIRENAPARTPLPPHELKALAMELAAAMPPLPAKTLRDVLADAFALNPSDREVIEKYLSANRRVGLDLDPGSIRSTSDEDLRALWGRQTEAREAIEASDAESTAASRLGGAQL